jgi:hypothetical protein
MPQDALPGRMPTGPHHYHRDETMQQRTGTAAVPPSAHGADPTATAKHPDQRRVLARSALLTLGPIVTSPRTARVSAMAQLSQWGRGHVAADTAAIVAELVTNAIAASIPADTPVGFGMILTDSSVIVEVYDYAPGEPAPGTPAPEAESGRGLHMVAALSRQWGWSLLRGSKVVWAEVAA